MIEQLTKRLQTRELENNKRYLKSVDNLIDFASNDYLGLARSPELAQRIALEIDQQNKRLNGFGSTGSRLLTGHSSYCERIEEQIAHFHQYEAALLFNCGYMANLGLLSTIASKNDVIIFDVNVHPSTKDGIRLSLGDAYPFRHQDVDHLEKRLHSCQHYQNRFVCIESLYSTDGTIAPIQQIYQLVDKYKAQLIVDEAHSVGIYGSQGRGLSAEAHLTNKIFAQIVTFGKALGGQGAAILGGKLLKEYLINFAHSFIYTTALPLNALAAIKSVYEYLPECEKMRSDLRTLIDLFQKDSQQKTPIQTIKFKSAERAKFWVSKLAKEGFDTRALLSPTVRKGHEVIRICLHAFNTKDEVNFLISFLKKVREDE
jgi:8-amino-7-oxononanoate synthase